MMTSIILIYDIGIKWVFGHNDELNLCVGGYELYMVHVMV